MSLGSIVQHVETLPELWLSGLSLRFRFSTDPGLPIFSAAWGDAKLKAAVSKDKPGDWDVRVLLLVALGEATEVACLIFGDSGWLLLSVESSDAVCNEFVGISLIPPRKFILLN